MRRVLILSLLWVVLATTGIIAQTAKSDEYLFEQFSESTVIYKDGRRFTVRINYNLVDRQYVFYDQVDTDQIKIFAEEKLVAAIKIGNRTFRITPKGEAEEILLPDPFLSVVYGARLKDPPKRAAYGGTSETTAIQSYRSFKANGVNYNLESERMIILGTSKVYHVEKDKKDKTFRNAKQFISLYPKQKAKLESYIEEQQIEFSDPEQIIELFRYANSLE